MIKPLIQPRTISKPVSGIASNPISKGLITAARNSVNKVQESTQTISKGLDKDQKFAMNYVEFFGSKKTTKILKKNLKSIRDSLMSTFEMAKTLKKKVAEMSKGGGIGGLLGGVAGFLGKGLLGGLLGKVILGSLIGLATGGITFLLANNVGKFFKFLDENIDQLTPIIEKIIKRTASKTLMPGGLPELIDETDESISDDIVSLLESDDKLSRDDAVQKAVTNKIDEIQGRINDLKLQRSELSFFDIMGKAEINSAIKRLEQAQTYLKTGDKFENIERDFGAFAVVPAFTAKFFANKFLGGTPVPTGYNNMTADKRLITVTNFVENSPKNLDALEFEVLRSSRLAGRFPDEGKTRFYEDVLNYIKAKKSDIGTKEFKVLPEQFDINATQSGNIQEFKNRFGDVLKFKPSSKNKKGDLNIYGGGGSDNKRGSGVNNNNNVSSAPPDSGIIDVAFYSPLDSDMSMERGSAKNILNVYMG
jgi:uncharacterized protein YerC